MKIIMLLLLTIEVAVPVASRFNQKQRTLQEIMHSVDIFPKEKAKDHWVPEAVTLQTCNHKNLCKAGKAMEKIKAEDFGLKEKEWKLPRLLASYSHENCTKPDNHTTVPFPQLLEDIHACARKEFSLLTFISSST